MALKPEEVLKGVLSTTFNLDEEGVAALTEADGSFKDDAVETLNGITAERVQKAAKDKADSYSRGLKETMEKFERELRDEYDLKDSKLTGKALVAAVVAKKLNGEAVTTEDKVKAHQLYIEKEEKVNAIPKMIEDAVKAREAELQAGFKEERDTARIMDRAKVKFKSMNPVLPKNEAVAQAQMTLLEQYVKQHKFQLVEENGEIKDIIPMKADGSGRLENALGHHVKFDQFVEDGAKRFFEFADGEERSGAPDPNSAGKQSGSGDGGTAFDPKSEADYAKAWQGIADSDLDVSEKRKQYDALKEAGKRNGVAS